MDLAVANAQSQAKFAKLKDVTPLKRQKPRKDKSQR